MLELVATCWTAQRLEVDEQDAVELNRCLVTHIIHLPEHPEVTIEYFVPDERKPGGAYVAVTGRVRHVSVPKKTLVMGDGVVISLADVVSAASEIF